MSLQQITSNFVGSEGIKKEINKNSIDIVFDILQVYAYSKPIESTVRELASNAVDAQREKEIATLILSGKKKVEDFFITKHGKEYEDSMFDSSYYDLEWLSDNTDVELEYRDNPGSGFCDEFIVRDFGVGLGGKRLKGILQLGYSSKRTTNELIGSYGLGNKAPLSTLTPFFTIQSAYNGKLSKLNVYSKKIDDLIGPFNLETGEDNPFTEFEDGTRIYHEPTSRKNFTEIIVPVKKINKQKFIHAVESQLLYLSHIKFFITENGETQKHPFTVSVLYESDTMIITNSNHYAKPHLIVVKDNKSNTGICYNEINYQELELEQRWGKVGLKVQIKAVGKDENGEEYVIHDGITVTPNRESVVWNDDTKRYLLLRIKEVADEASALIDKKLIEEDFLEWITKASAVLGRLNSDPVLYEISRIIDSHNIVPTYCKDKSVTLKSGVDLMFGLFARRVKIEHNYRTQADVITRFEVRSLTEFADMPVYVKLRDTPASNIKDRYLTSLHNSFILLNWDIRDDVISKTLENLPDEDAKQKLSKNLQRAKRIFEYITNSAQCSSYELIEVPDSFKNQAEEEEKRLTAAEEAASMTLAELRKLNEEIVFFGIRRDESPHSRIGQLVWDKACMQISKLSQLTGKIFYGFQEDSNLLRAACMITGSESSDWWNKNLRFVKIARQNVKHFNLIGSHISTFFQQISNSIIMVDENIKEFFTGRYIQTHLFKDSRFDFLKNYSKVNPELYQIYMNLKDQEAKYSRCRGSRFDLTSNSLAEHVIFDRLLKYEEFQLFVDKHSGDSEKIKERAQELFNTNLIVNAEILDLKAVHQIEMLEEYIEPLHLLFNKTDFTCLSDEALPLINVILNYTGRSNFVVPDELKLQGTNSNSN